MEITLKDIEVQKLNLKPDDVLVVKLIGDAFMEEDTVELRNVLKQLISNKVLVLSIPSDNSIDLTIVQSADKFECEGCEDCNCEDVIN